MSLSDIAYGSVDRAEELQGQEGNLWGEWDDWRSVADDSSEWDFGAVQQSSESKEDGSHHCHCPRPGWRRFRSPPPHRKLSPHPPTLTLFSSSPLYPTAILQERFGSICLLQNREHALDPITPHKLCSVFSVLQP
jgi:hypothetical protein